MATTKYSVRLGRRERQTLFALMDSGIRDTEELADAWAPKYDHEKPCREYRRTLRDLADMRKIEAKVRKALAYGKEG